MMTNDVGVFKKIYKTKVFKKARHIENNNGLEGMKVNQKLARNLFFSQMDRTQQRDAFTKVVNVIFDYHIKVDDTDGIQLIALELKDNLAEDKMLRALSEYFITPTLFKLILKEGLSKTKCYWLYDKESGKSYVTDWGKSIKFNFKEKDRDLIWKGIIETMKKEGREIG